MWKTTDGSTGRLLQLCVGYFVFYVITGMAAKYFTELGPEHLRMGQMQFLVYSTIGANLICIVVVLAKRWFTLKTTAGEPLRIGSLSFPRELLYIVPSGICTAIVIPTTTLMYTFGVSVMVAMVIMRGSVIVISRAVDGLQIRQGLLKKRVYREENLAVVFAILAVSVVLFWPDKSGKPGLLSSAAAVVVLSAYVTAYAIRIYIMNYYKNTRPKGAPLDNQGFFGIEQIAASLSMVLLAFFFFNAPVWLGWDFSQVLDFRQAIAEIHPEWSAAAIAGSSFGIVAFFSVFIFMFKGRTATFAGLVNRLTSLIAGTTATLLVALFFAGKLPKAQDWASLGLILVAVGFLSVAEKKRAVELAATKEVVAEPETTQAKVALRPLP